MPIGPNGEKRPADVVECAVTVMRIATDEEQDTIHSKIGKRSSKHPGKANGGKAGGKARASKLSPEKRREIAQTAAAARWGK